MSDRYPFVSSFWGQFGDERLFSFAGWDGTRPTAKVAEMENPPLT